MRFKKGTKVEVLSKKEVPSDSLQKVKLPFFPCCQRIMIQVTSKAVILAVSSRVTILSPLCAANVSIFWIFAITPLFNGFFSGNIPIWISASAARANFAQFWHIL
ncbi:RNA binding protein [Corchorus olitorius]|uniref:RNA binding protein n=1 Tax=Corchorus olitorius TaxID=93759 RepID=A0A1R3FU24_9ROSI|nr:RNA binding protein [Corchorus olitorius]